MASQTSGKVSEVGFKFTAEPGSNVFVAGTFNHWDPAQYKLRENAKKGVFATSLTLPTGEHEYKFVVNGVWCVDPHCAVAVPNAHGTHNSVLWI